MTSSAASTRTLLSSGLGIVVIGLLIAIVAVSSVTLVRPTVLAIAFGGLVIVLPTFLTKNPKLYWLFLLVVTIPFDIHKSVTRWIIEPEQLIELFGPPTTGTVSLDLYLSDVVLLAMVVPWLGRLSTRRDYLYFPNIGYIFIFFLAWALISFLLHAESWSLAFLEWCRELLYFVAFLYFINNIVTRAEMKTVVVALFIGLGIASGSVIAFSTLGLGTDNMVFSNLYGDREIKSNRERVYRSNTMYTTLDDPSRLGEGARKRSEGIFSHPAIAAAYCGLTVPLAAAFLLAARRFREVFVFGAFVTTGLVASYLTYSRAGLVALLFGCVVSFLAGRWARLVSRQRFISGSVFLAIVAAVCVPLLIAFIALRPESYSRRFDYIDIALEAYLQRPILGAGLNNGTIAVKEGSKKIENGPNSSVPGTIASHYLVVLIETGIVGFALFFAFVGQIVWIGIRSMRTVEREMKVVLVGITGGIASLAVQNLADNAFAGHSIIALLWLFLGLTIAIARQERGDPEVPTAMSLWSPPSEADRSPSGKGDRWSPTSRPGLKSLQ
jgi:hypothetical protein